LYTEEEISDVLYAINRVTPFLSNGNKRIATILTSYFLMFEGLQIIILK